MAQGAPLYVYSDGLILARDAEFIGHSHQFRERPRTHFAHDLAPMNPDSDLARAKLGGGLLIRQARSHQREDFALSRREKRIVLLQLRQFRSALARASIHGDCSVDRAQQFFVAKRFRQELDRAGLHGAYG